MRQMYASNEFLHFLMKINYFTPHKSVHVNWTHTPLLSVCSSYSLAIKIVIKTKLFLLHADQELLNIKTTHWNWLRYINVNLLFNPSPFNCTCSQASFDLSNMVEKLMYDQAANEASMFLYLSLYVPTSTWILECPNRDTTKSLCHATFAFLHRHK